MFWNLFRKRAKLTEAEEKYNRLWDLYANGELEKKNYPMFVLCDYESGVNGEGHSGFLFNNEDQLPRYDTALRTILPEDFYNNFQKAYHAYNTDREEQACGCADDFFYENEQRLLDILQEYANSL